MLREVERATTAAVDGGDHADVLRLPGDGDDARRPVAPARRRRFDDVRVRVELQPGLVERLDHRARAAPRWPSTASRRPGAAPRGGPVVLNLLPTRRAVALPALRLDAEVELTSEFGPTACKALYRCTAASSRSST